MSVLTNNDYLYYVEEDSGLDSVGLCKIIGPELWTVLSFPCYSPDQNTSYMGRDIVQGTYLYHSGPQFDPQYGSLRTSRSDP